MIDLDVTIAKFLIPRLKELKDTKNCYPESVSSMKEWHLILKKIIKAFEIVAKQQHLSPAFGPMLEDGNRDKTMSEGLELFAKHFTNLWT